MEERQHAEHHVVAVDHRRLDGGHLLDVGQQRPVGEHRGARAPRRTARVEQRGQLLRVRQRRYGARRLGAQVVVGALAGLQGGADDHDPRLDHAGEQVGLDRVGAVLGVAGEMASSSTVTAARTSLTQASSTTTIRDPESAIIRASSPEVDVGLTGTATAWTRSTAR